MAERYFNAFHEKLAVFLKKKALDKLDEYKNVIYKNLGVEMLRNTEFRKELGVHHNDWKVFCNTTLTDLIEELQTENIYVCEGKNGRKDTIKFYKMEG